MDLPDTLLRVYRCDDPAEALKVVADAVPALGAWWVDGAGTTRGAWPDGAPPPPGLAAPAADGCIARRPLEGGGTAVLLPLDPAGGTVALAFANGGAPHDDALEPLSRALGAVAARAEALRGITLERDDLRQRAEESEALHLLGLSANRTLDPDEVLTLVARFARTLLGAHYATVSTSHEGELRTVAAVGLLAAGGEDDPFARRVLDGGKPLTLGAGDAADLPFHAAEQMQAALGVPLSLFGDTFGALVVGYRRPYEVMPRDLRLALTLAGQAAVAISNARLHRDLADRSRELEQAYEELRWSAEAKERFFASMSHELRTPLNAIMGYQSLVLGGVVGQVAPEVRAFLENAQRATHSLLLLVNDVLDLSRLAAGRMELAPVAVPVRRVVEEAIATVRPLAAQKGLPVVASGPDETPVVVTDPDRMRQILINLLGNAVKFTERGQIAVQVLQVEGGVLGDRVEVRVTDSGPGIRTADQERIFHEFEQAGATPGGTGLGLPISRRLARLLGGDLAVQSEPGQGATFTLWLPAGTAV